MKNEEEIFAVQGELLKKAVELIDDRVKRLEPTEEEKPTITEARAAIIIFWVRSLRLYRDTLRFLSTEIMDADPRRPYFLLPHVRTLLDVYSRFLHLQLNCPDDNSKALTCVAYQQYTTKPLGDKQYKEGLGVYKKFLDVVMPNFPTEATSLKWKWMEKKNIAFASKTKLLTPENISRYSVHSLEMFKAEKTSDIYGHLSELLHGNPYYYDEEPRTERFWVAGMSILHTAFLIELIDRHILNRGQARDFREWLADVNKTRGEFVQFWQTNSRLRKPSK